LKFSLADEIDEFYSYCESKIEHQISMIKENLSKNLPATDLDEITQNLFFNKKDRVMDIDNLQGICVYMVYSM